MQLKVEKYGYVSFHFISSHIYNLYREDMITKKKNHYQMGLYLKKNCHTIVYDR